MIVTADQSSVASDFWIRAIPQTACSDNDNTDNIKGIWHYGTNTTISTPTTSEYTDWTDACVDEDADDLVPYVSKDVSDVYYNEPEAVSLGRLTTSNLLRWYMNSTTMVVEWDDPTLEQIYNGNTSYSSSSGVVEVADADEWVYLVIETTNNVPHPIHLHGHDFMVIATGTGTYDSTDVSLTNPVRRDTATLPGGGYLVLAFETDNPGAWLCHCHIGWHAAEGFAIQFIERYSEIKSLIDYDTLSDTCSAWETYAASSGIEEDDSGI